MKKILLAIIALISVPALHAWDAKVVTKNRRVPIMGQVPVMRKEPVIGQVPVMKRVPELTRVLKCFTVNDYADFRDELDVGLFPTVPAWGNVRWYHILGLPSPRGNRRAAIRQNYAKLVRATSPDKGADTANARAFQAVTEAAQEGLELPENTQELPSNLSATDRAELEERKHYNFVETGRFRDEPTGEYEEGVIGQKDVSTGRTVERETGRHRNVPYHEVQWSGTYNKRYRYFEYQGSGTVPEKFTLEDLFPKFRKDKMSALASEWKKFYITKLALLASTTLFFKKSERGKRLMDRWKRFRKNNPKTATLVSALARVTYIGLAALYPMYKFKRLFSNSFVDEGIASKKIPGDVIDNDDLIIFYKKVWNKNSRSQDGKPIGYMKKEDERVELMPLRKTKVMAALTAGASFASAWLGCAL